MEWIETTANEIIRRNTPVNVHIYPDATSAKQENVSLQILWKTVLFGPWASKQQVCHLQWIALINNLLFLMGHVLKSETAKWNNRNKTSETRETTEATKTKRQKLPKKNKPKTVNNNKINTQGCQGSAIIFLKIRLWSTPDLS